LDLGLGNNLKGTNEVYLGGGGEIRLAMETEFGS